MTLSLKIKNESFLTSPLIPFPSNKSLYSLLFNVIVSKFSKTCKGDIKHSLADVSNMKKIDYEVNLNDFENQLKETINWFKTKL